MSEGLKILYVAQHGQHNMDDEGAIVHAFEQLGHMVSVLHERHGETAHRHPADFLLCNHWTDLVSLKRVQIPKVFWCFDLIDWPTDPILKPRNMIRKAWLKGMMEVCDLGFLTDGDMVDQLACKTLHWLPQGFDERLHKVGGVVGRNSTESLVFVGGRRGGTGREDFISHMESRYSHQFKHIETGYYRDKLRNLFTKYKIVVAPDCPVSDRYWSNRLYTTLGMGSFLLHPDSKGIREQYKHLDDVVLYHDRHDLHAKIQFYLQESKKGERERIAINGKEVTKCQHLYRHRVEKLVTIVQEALL